MEALKLTAIVISYLLLISCVSATTQTNKLITSSYEGVYSYGSDPEIGRIGIITIYPETNDSVLFYLELNRGAPSYNMGNLYGRIKIYNGEGIFVKKYSISDNSCKWSIQFKDDKVELKTLDKQHDCDFGHNVIVDGVYNRTASKAPKYFWTQGGMKIYFDQFKSEK